MDEVSLNKIRTILDKHQIASSYKKTYLLRRIKVRMRKVECENLSQYLVYLKTNKFEIEQLKQDLSINVTRFFSDKE